MQKAKPKSRLYIPRNPDGTPKPVAAAPQDTQDERRQDYVKYKLPRVKRLQEWVDGIKADKGCFMCGFKGDPVALDFHHRDPKRKGNQVSTLVKQGRAEEVIKAEIDKCVVVCANCHRILHKKVRNG